jgi:hypothetical protein
MSDGGASVQALVAEASATSGGVAAVVDCIETACRSGGRFAVLIDARNAEGEMAGRDRRALLGRLRALRSDLKERCVGVVFLGAPAGAGDQADDQGKRLRAAGLLFGCPVHATGSLDAARDWLAARGATVPGEVRP